MPNYRRNQVPGGTYFFTVNLLDRRSDRLIEKIDVLREAIRATLVRSPFHIDAWVVLPDHMHCIWTLPDGDVDFPGRWKAIKTAFSKAMPETERRSRVTVDRGERGVWQRRYWEHTIRDDRDYAAHVDYVHFNPVRHGLVATPADWTFSSFHRWVAKGLYPPGWAGGGDEPTAAGERDLTCGRGQRRKA
jgi:putative transposase